MKVEAEPSLFKDKDKAHIMVRIFVDGRYCGGISVLAGPVREVQDYYDGKITMEEVEARWKAKRR
jgi:hypothetical protein